MALDSSGTKNQPLYIEGGTMELGVDFSAVSNYVAAVGNRRWGTSADRLALTSEERWLGMGFWDTDLGYEFIWDGSQWAGGPVYISDASAYLTMSSNWTLENAQLTIHRATVSLRAHVIRATSTIASNASGNIVNTDVLTIDDPALHPYDTIALSIDSTGYLGAFALYGSGLVQLSATPPGYTVAVGDRFAFSGTWLRDVTAT